MRVGFFGSIGEQLGREVDVDTAGARTVADLRVILADTFPGAADHIKSPGLKACIDDVMASDETELAGAKYVEFFPPLSGG